MPILLLIAFVVLQFALYQARAFDVPDDYARQGYHQCDSPSGWCAKNDEREDPCGKR